jgi:hypothetical protein
VPARAVDGNSLSAPPVFDTLTSLHPASLPSSSYCSRVSSPRLDGDEHLQVADDAEGRRDAAAGRDMVVGLCHQDEAGRGRGGVGEVEEDGTYRTPLSYFAADFAPSTALDLVKFLVAFGHAPETLRRVLVWLYEILCGCTGL